MDKSAYRKTKLAEIADFRNGKSHGYESAPIEGEFPIYGSNGKIGRGDKALYHLPLSVIGRVGAYCGSLHFADASSWITDNAIAAIAKDGVDQRYLHYLLKSLSLERIAIGSAQPLLTQNALNLVECFVAPPRAQQKISSILGALDDKIELNRKMSATLEAMARAIYTSWFVDFDPVRAKVQGQSIGLASEIADFFPNVLERSEARYVPSGWNVQTLSSLCHSIERGLSPIYQPGSNRFIINQKVNRGSTLDLSQLKELAINFNVGAAKMTQEWDVLVNCLGEGTLGRIYLFRSTESYAVDQHMAVCRPRNQGIGAFIYQILNSVDGQNTIESIKTGSTGMTMLNISRLRDFPCLWPGKALIDAYGESVRPIWKRINAAERESQLLTALRDLLLPKLISGELRVSEAERILEISA